MLDTHTHVAGRLWTWLARLHLSTRPRSLCGLRIHGADPGAPERLDCLSVAAQTHRWAAELYEAETGRPAPRVMPS